MEKIIIKPKLSFIEKISLIGSKDERNFIIENLAIMLGAGLSVTSALDSILKSLRNKTLIKIIKNVILDMDEGSSLYIALSKTTLLPFYALSLIKIGEESGNLIKNLQAIALQQQKEESLNSKLQGAMIYPILVLSITIVVGLGVAWFILPNLAKVFSNLTLELPLITRIFISFGEILSNHGIWLVPILVFILFLSIYLVFYNKKTNHFGQYLLFVFPISKRLIINLELSRMGYILSSLLSAGIPIGETVKLLEESSRFYFYKKFYLHLGDGFNLGNSFKTSFSQYPNIDKIIPPSIQEVISSGEQSGKLSESLILVSNRFEQKTEQSIKNLPIILEPVFLVIIWIGVLMVAIAVILPIYSLVGNLNNSPTNSSLKK
jgi:type IV pilus assembly protein PilC